MCEYENDRYKLGIDVINTSFYINLVDLTSILHMRGIFSVPSFFNFSLNVFISLYIVNASEGKYSCHSSSVTQSSPLCIRFRNC